MANERSGYQLLPVKNALDALSRASGKQVPGLEVPIKQLTGGAKGERLLLAASGVGANLLTGDTSITSLRLAQIEVGGDIDTILEIRRGQQGDNTELLLSGGRASVIRDNPGNYHEYPAEPHNEALARRVLTSIAGLG